MQNAFSCARALGYVFSLRLLALVRPDRHFDYVGFIVRIRAGFCLPSLLLWKFSFPHIALVLGHNFLSQDRMKTLSQDRMKTNERRRDRNREQLDPEMIQLWPALNLRLMLRRKPICHPFSTVLLAFGSPSLPSALDVHGQSPERPREHHPCYWNPQPRMLLCLLAPALPAWNR